MNTLSLIFQFLVKISHNVVLFLFLLVIIWLQISQIQLINKKLGSANGNGLTPPPNPANLASDVFSSQTAVVRGKITSIGDKKLSIENDKKIKADFDAGRVVLINDGNALTVASNSADLKKIQVNKDATINLLYSGNNYLITSITYR